MRQIVDFLRTIHPSVFGRTRVLAALLLVLLAAGCAQGSRSATARASLDTIPYADLVYGSVGGRDAYASDVRALPEFAGVYVQGCDVVVLLSPATRDARAQAELRFDEHIPVSHAGHACDGRVSVREARYSWRDLTRWYYDNLKLESYPGVEVHALNMARNRIVIGVADEPARGYVERRVARAGVPSDAVIIAYTAPIPPPAATYSLVVAVTEQPSLKPVHGAQIRVRARSGGEAAAVTHANGRAEVTLAARGWYAAELVVPTGYALVPGSVNPRQVEIYRVGDPFVIGFQIRSVDTRRGQRGR